jgi:hypothetical protein
MSSVRQPQGEPGAELSWAPRNRVVVGLGLSWLRAALSDYIAALRAVRPPGGNWSGRPKVMAKPNRTAFGMGLIWRPAGLSDYIAALRVARPPGESLTGLPEVMTDQEADWLLRGTFVPPPRSAIAEAARAAYEAERAAMRETERPAAIDRLSQLFGLTPFDEDCLLLAAAPRLDAAFVALFGYAHDRLQVVTASPHLAIALFAGGEAEAMHLAFERLSPAAPLRRLRLVEADQSVTSLLAPLETDERVARVLAGEDYPDARVESWLAPVPAAPCPHRHRVAAAGLANTLRTTSRPSAIIIGPRGSGRVAVAQAVARQHGLALVTLRTEHLPERGPTRQAAFALLAREAALGGYALLIDAADVSARREAAEALRQLEACAFVIAEEPLEADASQLRLQQIETTDRVALWRQVLGPSAVSLGSACERIAEQFPLGPAAIAAIAAANPTADERVLWVACREVAGRELDTLAERIVPRFVWDDIVLPAAVADDLRAVTAQVRHRAEVYGRGGFGRKLVRGRGVTALFAGPSGTGKTMAAEIIASELGLDLCRIDLSGVVSKYIGETERNLKRVFDAAEAGGAVLFFDEADALFGKRSEVKDSHDRYANIEISYLLQRMEGYSGLAVLATNLKAHLDPAFLRRLRYVIDFPFPDAAQRRSIWARAFPPETATDGLDIDGLARLEVAGGNIAVIAVNAAFLAAAEGAPVRKAHIARAARAEFRKLDKEFRALWPVEGR